MSLKSIPALAVLLVLPCLGEAQTVMRPSVRIPALITMEPLSSADTDIKVPLKWVCGDSVDDTSVPLNTVITRQKAYGGSTITFVETLKTHAKKAAAPESYPGTGFGGQIFIDKTDPSKIRVNPFLSKRTLKCGGVDQTWSPEKLRDIEFYYSLKDRQYVHFRTRQWVLGGATIPLRFRGQYTASNGQKISSDVSSKVSVGAYGGHTWGSVGYNYIQHGENALKERWKVTLAAFASVSEGSAGAETSKSATVPLTATAKFAVLAPGVGVLSSVKGLDLGLFLGPEYAIASDVGRKWDYHGRWAVGVGAGFGVWAK